MSGKNIIGVILALAVLGFIVWAGRPAPSGPLSTDRSDNTASILQNSGGALNGEESSFDFGTISMAAGTVRHEFKIKNTGSEPVSIEKIYTSCMCTIATLDVRGKKVGPYGMPGHGFIPRIGEKLEPDEEAVVEVAFDPAAHGPAGVGRIQRAITIENSAGEPLELWFTVFVTP